MYIPQNPPIKTHYIGYNGLISYCFLIASYMTVMPGAPETVLVSRHKNKYQVCSCASKSFNQNALYRTPCFD